VINDAVIDRNGGQEPPPPKHWEAIPFPGP
jgi:hypothetical protein